MVSLDFNLQTWGRLVLLESLKWIGFHALNRSVQGSHLSLQTEGILIVCCSDSKVMSVGQSADKVWNSPIGRLVTLLVGGGLVAGALTMYPQILPVVRWAVPVSFVLWGASRLYLYGVGDSLSLAAGCLLILGGFTSASYLLISMDELTGTVAQLVPVIGIFTELFAAHYRNQD